VQTLLDYIEAGDMIDEFLRGFPTVTREHVVAFLERAATLAVHEAARRFFSTKCQRPGLENPRVSLRPGVLLRTRTAPR
jgi:hypothetical protein